METWTEEQREAVASRGGNLLVAASAGTGKTAVLVERIVRRITDPRQPVDVDRLLVVTFTNAAAAEMRERVGRALYREMERQPGSRLIERQLALLGRASISTIHSFCLDQLRQNFYRLDLDPSFRVADETEAALLQSDTLEDLFEKRYGAAGNNEFTALVDCYGGSRDDAGLQEVVLDIYKFSLSMPWPEEWLSGLESAYDLPPGTGVKIDDLAWAAVLKQTCAAALNRAGAILTEAVRLASGPCGPSVYLSNLNKEIECVQLLLEACSVSSGWERLYELFNNREIFSRLKPCRDKNVNQETAQRVLKLREQAKKCLAGLHGAYFMRSPAGHYDDLRTMAPLIRELVALVRDFAAAYRGAKAAHGLVDFNDLEHFCLALLAGRTAGGTVPSPLARDLQDKYIEVLVDEYQDINAVQDTILQLVSRQDRGQPNLFMVGDVKQSIYRFRLAEPALFLDKYHRYKTEPGPQRRIDLNKNFRSCRAVVDAVNFIFRQAMTAGVAGMSYDISSELVYGAARPPAPEPAGCSVEDVEIHLIERAGPREAQIEEDNNADPDDVAGPALPGAENIGPGKDEAALPGLEELSEVQKEASLIARRIREMVSADKGSALFVYDRVNLAYRPVEFRDIVVLMRATAGYANTFLEEFRQNGIPAYAELSSGYFAADEVETILSVLKVIDNPRQDIPLAGVLRSPAAGLNASELAEIKLEGQKAGLPGDFYDDVVKAAETARPELANRIKEFLSRLEDWRTVARQGGLADLIGLIYRDTGYYDYIGGMPGGTQRQANLRMLQYRARQYENTTFRGLFHFLRFIERLRGGGRDLGAARALGEKENVVRVMSVHKSKGLEFPVVFVAGLGRQFNFRDLNQTILFHKELGIGPQLVDAGARFSYPTLAKLALRQVLKHEAIAEEMRVLYVALTRARDKLVLVGSSRDLPAQAGRWCSTVTTPGWQLPQDVLENARCCLDWLMPAVARHRDGSGIRGLARCGDSPPDQVAGDCSRWQVNIWTKLPGMAASVTVAASGFMDKVRRLEPLNCAGPHADLVKARLEWQYPATAVLGRAAKLSVTEAKRRFGDLDEEITEPPRDRTLIGVRPGFLQEVEGLSGPEMGAAMHLALQNLELGTELDEANVAAQIDGMVQRELLTGEQAGSIKASQIAAFFTGSLGRRVIAGLKVWRELPFTLAIRACEVHPELVDYHDEEMVLLQGVIDCLVEEDDGFLLLDYKTDRIGPGQLEQAVRRYHGQLDVYARAVESIMRRRVKEKYLYFFHLGRAVKCE